MEYSRSPRSAQREVNKSIQHSIGGRQSTPFPMSFFSLDSSGKGIVVVFTRSVGPRSLPPPSHLARRREPHGVTPPARDLYQRVRDQAFHQGGGSLVHLVPVAELPWYDDDFVSSFAFSRGRGARLGRYSTSDNIATESQQSLDGGNPLSRHTGGGCWCAGGGPVMMYGKGYDQGTYSHGRRETASVATRSHRYRVGISD